MNSTISRCLTAEPDSDSDPINEQEQVSLQNNLRERLLELRRRNYSNTGIADAKAIEKISSDFEILVFGPARVGKSTLIGELSGDEQIRTSAGLNSCTQMTTLYTDKFGVRWWDTCGIEQWTEENVRSFLKEKFRDQVIIPRAAIFCRGAGALAKTSVLKLLFRELESHDIVLFYVITKWPFLSEREQIEIVDEAVGLLDGKAAGIYPAKAKEPNANNQQVEVITASSGIGCCGRRRVQPLPGNAPAPIASSTQYYRALECQPNISYIIPVNSRVDQLRSSTVPVMNLIVLRQLIILKTCRGTDNDQKLIDLYKNQISFLTNIGYHALEVLDDLGFGAASVGLNKNEEKTYRAIKQGDENKHMATRVAKKVFDKLF